MLVFSSSLIASADDALTLDSTLTSELSHTEQKNTMTWPMLPGESLNDVARLFYPNNKLMQRLFVAKTLKLSADIAPDLKPTERFTSPTLLVLPTLKSLSKNSANKASKQTLKMSYGLKQAMADAPEKLMQEYELLLSKNAFLKEQLNKLLEKIVFLQSKLDELKLIFDKTLTLPDSASEASVNAASSTVAEPSSSLAEQTISQPTAKKVFKNLNQAENKKLQTTIIDVPAKSSWFDSINVGLVKVALAIAALLLLGAFMLKKYRERMFAKFSFATTKLQHTVTDFSAYFETPKAIIVEQSPEVLQQVQAAKEVESRLSATLEEAKLLMSVNRATDAIEHLKMTIKSQPKASINHWLYLLEVYRKLNLKDEFEEYANGLHETFNVMTPVWYEKEAAATAAMVVPQSLEEFPHIMDQLYGVWPGELATVYLRSLITDNRGGERVGFGKAVLSEILLLIALLDTRKELPN